MIRQNGLAEASDRKVLKALMQKSPQTWTELVETTGVSTRTLRKALIRLERRGLIYRRVEVSDKYPPPVIYGLTEKAKESIHPIVWSSLTHFWAWGYEITPTDADLHIIMRLKPQRLSLTWKDLHVVARRLMARSLYGLVKFLETGIEDWYYYPSRDLLLSPLAFSHLALLDKVKVSIKTEKEKINGFEVTFMKDIILSMPESKEKEVLNHLREAVRFIFKNEWKTLEKFFQETANLLQNITFKM